MRITGYIDIDEEQLNKHIEYALSQYLDASESYREPFKTYLQDSIEEDLTSDFYMDDKALDLVSAYARNYLTDIIKTL